MTWILVICIYSGIYARGDSVAITHINGFASERDCNLAGARGSYLTKDSTKEYRYVCLPQAK